MSTEFSVDMEQLDQIVTRLAGLAGFVADHLDQIDDQVAKLQGSTWEGLAADAYRIAHQQWIVGAREFAEGIGDMSNAAKAAHGRYSAAADANKRMLQSG
ncbi:WXG100 family type VII secretion target [Nocardia mangyaensis]|uniref:WXG100 family type VII secretion target n=1 Tax=Nocardia mangyaensis TaxID=2213200 RepID=UPI002674667C|nr:WXG100 family type VII secretion target [Nocardia mangyaensis]MDO3649490.1 WXG100 family type VII secretion target [Nocardia mangyaensis]